MLIPALLLAGLLLLNFTQLELAAPIVTLIMAGFAMTGIAAVTALASGVIHFAQSNATKNVSKTTSFQPSGLHPLDSLPWAAVLVDAKGHVLAANDAYRQLIEVLPQTVNIKTIGAAGMRPDLAFSEYPDLAPAFYRLTKTATQGQIASEIIQIRLPGQGQAHNDDNGPNERWFQVRVRPWRNNTDHPSRQQQNPAAGKLWEFIDITTQRRQNDKILRQLKTVLDHIDGIPAGFFSADASGRIDHLNKTLSDWLGLKADAVLPGSLFLADIVAGDGAAMLTVLRPKDNGSHTQTFNIDLIRADGKRFPARLWHRVEHDPITHEPHFRTLVLPGRSEAERSDDGRAAERRFARFYHAAPFAIATVSTDGRIIAANAKFAQLAVVGCNQSAGEGIILGETRLSDLVDETSAKALERAFAEARAGLSEITPIEVAFGGKRDRLARLYAAPMGADDTPLPTTPTKPQDSSENDENLIIYALDTTAQKALEEQFAQSQKMQAVGQLAGGIAHDFNNVLTAIIGFSDLLLRNQRHTDPSFRDIMNIKQNAIRAAGLVRQLMAFSRQQTLRPEVLILSDKLSDLSIWLGRLLGERVTLKVNHGRDLWPVKVDGTQFDQVIMNLAVNARDAMKDGGTLTISTRNVSQRETRKLTDAGMIPGDYVLCEVSDTGTGMSEEVAAKIFDPFFTTKKVGEGTGLGLATVYGIIKQTGGFIYVDSVLGQGTTFRIYLPRHIPSAEDTVTATSQEETKASETDLTGSETILLVEDEEAVRTFAARALTSRGYNVFEATNGIEALEVMARINGAVDLVISDVVMPEMDGPALLKELRKHNPALKIIFMSGYAEDAFKRGLEQDQEDFNFLAKPFSLKQLAATVKETLS